MTVRDPVCGMQIDIGKAVAQEDLGGWVYFFCSDQCHRLFKASPERYASTRQSTGAAPAGSDGGERGRV